MLIGFRVILTTAFENFTQVMLVTANQFGNVVLFERATEPKLSGSNGCS